MADISFNIACKELKIAQIAQLNQLCQLLHLVHMHSHGFYELSRMLMGKKMKNNDVSTDSPMDHRWRQNVVKTKKWHTSRCGISTPSVDTSRPSRDRHSFFQISTSMSESSLMRVVVLASLFYSYLELHIVRDKIHKPLLIKQETE